MKRHFAKFFTVMAAVMFLGITVMEHSAHARAGSSRSMGSRGSRSYSRPASPSYQPSQRSAPTPSPYQPQQSGGFLRNMAGGMLGGMLGSMLFRGTGFAGSGGMGGGGIGLFEILLLAGIGYLIYRFIKKKRADSNLNTYAQGGYQDTSAAPMYNTSYQDNQPQADGVDAGLSHIRQMDGSFDENRFNDTAMDIFFKIQGAWMNRDLTPVSGLLTDEMKRIFQEDLDKLLRNKQINRLENIAVRNVEIEEAWQESGQDYITALIYANLLDYTTDDTSGAVVSGSKTDPVKFEEYWTFTRPVGNNPWRLSAINQK
jgi:predicted lipid-binding transport protein (Tim44 family)